MEKFQGPTNPCFFGEQHLNNVERLEELEGGGLGLGFSYGSSFSNNESFRFQEEEDQQLHHLQQQQQQQQQQQEEHEHEHSHLLIPNLHEKMPFLQMLQSVESPPLSPFPDQTHFQLLLKLQQQQQQQQEQVPWVGRSRYKYLSTEMDSRIQALELESCITHEVSEAHSPIKSETYKDQTFPQSCSHLEVMSSFCNAEPNSPETNFNGTSWVDEKPAKTQFPKPTCEVTTRERRKRKRTRPSKNKDEVETQRMTHIAVERNRRKQMNDHLNALKSLMPTSFIQRGDQASIIGGAIDFVKELEQLLQSLEAKKKMRELSEQEEEEEESAEEEEEDSKNQQQQMQQKKKRKKKSDESLMAFSGFFSSPQYNSYSSLSLDKDDYHNHNAEKGEDDDKIKYSRDEEEEEEEEVKGIMKKCVVADIEVIVIQTHVNLKILCPRRPGQLLRTIAALEDLRLTILHLNVTSLQPSVLYSFNLKIEDDCKLGSADEIAAAVHQIFSFINSSTTTTTSINNN